MTRNSRLLEALRIAEDFLVLFDSYFRDPIWVTETIGLPEIKKRKAKWYAIKNELISSDFKIKQKSFSLFRFLKKWDNKWRLVLFDIPEEKRDIRDQLRKSLKEIGFKNLQRSVWINPLQIDKKLKQIENQIENRECFYIFKGSLPEKESKIIIKKFWEIESWQLKATNLIEKKERLSKIKFNQTFWTLLKAHPKVPLELLSPKWPLKNLIKAFVNLNTSVK